MATAGFTLFDTAIGRCGIVWTERGIASVCLPEASETATRARLRRRSRGAGEMPPPPFVRSAIDAIVALLRGEPRSLAEIALDMERVPAFERRVYEVARTIPPGATRSYGEIAIQLGDPSFARDVGRALARNPFSIVVPCHRVLAAHGELGGFSAHGGLATKFRLLAIEGLRTQDQLGLFDRAAAPLVSCRRD